MTTRKEILDHLDHYLHPVDFQDFCPNGLQVEGSEKVGKVVTAVSANMATIELAIKKEADLLIVHHGLFWKGESAVISGVKKQKLELLFKSGINLVGYHLPLDAHPVVGNNFAAAKELGWKNLEPFCQYQGIFLGVRGEFAPKTRDEFQDELEKYYERKAQVAFGGKETVTSAALISGGGDKMMGEAIAVGVDCYITGRCDEPNWNQAHDEGINFYALGHSATERVGPRALAKHLADELSIDAEFIDVPNPF